MTDHAWFREQLPQHLLGILPDAEATRLLHHAEECPECGGLLRRLEASGRDWWEGTDHISISLLGSFAREGSPLDTESRRLIAAHVAICDLCRDALKTVRQSLGDATGAPISDGPRGRSTARGMRWLWRGGLSIAALAASVLLVTRLLPSRPPEQRPPAVVPPIIEDEASSRVQGASPPAPDHRPPASPTPRVETVMIRNVERMGSFDTTIVLARPGVLSQLRVPLLRSPASRVRIGFVSAAGDTILRREMSGNVLARVGITVDANDLGTGIVLMTLGWTDASGDPGHRAYVLEVRKPD